MKRYAWILTVVAAATIAIAGCGKKSSVDTKPLENSFQSAEPTTKSSAEKVVSSVKAGDYASATAELKTLASNANLTPAQQQAIKDVMAQIQKAIGDTVNKAAGEAEKATKDLQKSLPGK